MSRLRHGFAMSLVAGACVALALFLSSCRAPVDTTADARPPDGTVDRPVAAAPAPDAETPAPDAVAGELGEADGQVLELFVGSASKPATEEAIVAFEQQTGAEVIAHYGGSGQMLSQIKVTGRGDIYFPGSSDFMAKAEREGLVDPETEQIVVYLLPAINVPAGNPKGIEGIEDLAKPGVRVGIARPDAVCVGLYAAEVLEKAGLAEAVRANLTTQTESCAKTAQLVALGSVDCVLGWRVFHYWQPDKIETVLLKPEQISRIGYIPIAVCRDAVNRPLAEAFIAYVVGPEGKEIYRKWHYLTSEEEARELAEPTTPVGGEYELPEGWQ